MKVIFTCGGTAGHVNPALALAGYMREKDAGTQILFVGAERGLERDLIAHTDYPFRTVNISSFHRSFKPAEIKHNLVSLKNLAHAEREANAILNDFHPDLIVGTGGYASYPLVRYGAKAGIPTAVHESNIGGIFPCAAHTVHDIQGRHAMLGNLRQKEDVHDEPKIPPANRTRAFVIS